jgi:hypothetical protein
MGFRNAGIGAIDFYVDGFLGRDRYAHGPAGAVARTRPKRAAHVGLESSTVAATDRRGCICSGPAHGCHPHAPVCMGGLPAWAGWGCGNAYVAAIDLCDEFRRQPVQRKRTQRPGCRCVGEVPAMADPRRVRMEDRQEFD